MDLLYLVTRALLFGILVIECGSTVGGRRHRNVDDDDGRAIEYRWDGRVMDGMFNGS